MKLLISLILILFCSTTFAGPGDGPIVPWPTTALERISAEDLQGEWVAYTDDSVWLIRVWPMNLNVGASYLEMESAALFTRQAFAWLYCAGNVVWGTLIMDDNHEANFLIYKDHEGTKMRLNKGRGRYIDIKLYRTE